MITFIQMILSSDIYVIIHGGHVSIGDSIWVMDIRHRCNMWPVYTFQFREVLDAYSDDPATRDTEQYYITSFYLFNI